MKSRCKISMTKRIFTTLWVLCLTCKLGFGQDMVLSGTVKDVQGSPMPGVAVLIKGTTLGVVTQNDGTYSLSMGQADKDAVLVFSFLGFKTQELKWNGKTVIDVTLEEERQELEGVVVTALGIKREEKGLGYSTQTVTEKMMSDATPTNWASALVGKVAGANILSTSSGPISSARITLRGDASLNIDGNNALIVLDGVPLNSQMTGDGSNSYGAGGGGDVPVDYGNGIADINPDDIASITVLKDAAGTAIYGSQGANGVIEIKTKRGVRGKTKVTYSYAATMTYQPKGMRMLNGDQYTMLMKEAYYNPELSDAASDIPEFNYDPSFAEYEHYNNNTDWVDAVTKVGWLQKHYVTLSGGGEKAAFRISAGYDHQTGTVIAQELDRFTTRVALDYFVSDRIKIVTNFNLTYQDNQKNYSDLLNIAYRKMPNMSIYEQDAYGNNTPNYYHMLPTASSTFRQNGDQYSLVNPVALAYEATNEETLYRMQPEFQLHYNLLGLDDSKMQLKYEGKVLFNIEKRYTDKFYPSSLVTAGWTDKNNNKATSEAHKGRAITTTHRLTFIPHFMNADHSFMAMAQFQLIDGDSKQQSNSVYNLPTGSIQSPTADGLISGMSTGAGQWRSIYMTFSAHYAFKSRYIADFSVRRDGTTKFGDNKRWGTFPALSFRWNVVDEPWMKGAQKWLSMLSVRPGWGRVGSQPGAEYLFFSKYTATDSYNGANSIYPSNIRLSNLQWEEKETWNVGFDLGLFDNRVTADFNIYTQMTSKLLMTNVNIPSSSGFPSLSWTNVGKMRNNGWEFNINGTDVVKVGKFRLGFNVTFANNKNEIVEMEPTALANLNKDYDNNNGSYLTRVQLNNPFGAIYGFRYKGVYQYSDYSEVEVPGVSGPNAPVARDENGNVIRDKAGFTIPMVFGYDKITNTELYEFQGGDAIYEDINHDGNINELDIVYLGSSLPKITGWIISVAIRRS